jgi:2-polyprenyl-3-methyl-5-hydroxy-6-metoxy-1,4-benzoquinol methylase
MMKSTDVRGIYDSGYFLTAVDGYREFSGFDGSFDSLFPRYQRNIDLLDLMPQHNLLEVGCGRGEVCIYHVLRGGHAKGVDFSADAIQMACEKAASLNAAVEFVESSFDAMHEPAEIYDRILASEFIEHVSRQEGELFFKKAYSMLKPGGKLLVYTFPNTLQRRFGYPIQRIWGFLRGKPLPKQQEDTTIEHHRLYHLNEQNYFSLKTLAAAGGFHTVKVGYDMEKTRSKSIFKRMIMGGIKHTPLRHVFLCNLYLLAEK